VISRTAWFDLRRGRREDDRAMLRALYGVPKGGHVVLDIGDRSPSDDTARLASKYAFDLHIQLVGTTRATEQWERALRGEPWWEAVG
jgi:hypothetical protein